MSIHAHLAELRHRGVWLRTTGDRLVATPASALSSADADWIRANKPAIRAVIEAAESPGSRMPFRPRCVTCDALLDDRSAVRCPACVDVAYLARDERRRSEGRAPPADELPDDAPAAAPADETPYPVERTTS